MTPLVAGLLLGAAGSLHCLAMCGPLVMAMRAGALYHVARVATYVLAGLAAGLVGRALDLADLGRALSIAAGLLLLAMAAGRAGLPIGPRSAGRLGGFIARLIRAARRRTEGRPAAGALAAGALNALLPCGLVYAALAAAAAMGSPASSAGFMLAFGAGTVPALAALSVFARSMSGEMRGRLRLAVPIALAMVGVLLVARGVMAPEVPDGPRHHHAVVSAR